MLSKKIAIVLVGGGGHCKVIIDAIKNSKKFDIIGIVDSNLPQGKLVLGVEIIGTDEDLPRIYKQGVKNAFISIGSTGDCSIRRKIYDNLKGIGFSLPLIIHSKSVIAEDVQIQEGTFVAAGVVINPGVKIGKNVIVNTSSSIDHDCIIGDFVHIAPGVTLSGGVEVGENTHIGTGAKVKQYVKIGKNCLIKMAALVKSDVPDGHTIGMGVFDTAEKNE